MITRGGSDMEKIINVAQYIFNEYKRVTGEIIDEMKLQKLLYFSQRETIAILNKPLFFIKLNPFCYKLFCQVNAESLFYFSVLHSLQ